MEEHSPECSEISFPASAGCMLEPASVKRDDIILKEEVLSKVDNLKVPRFPDHNDEYRKLNGDGMVTLLRHETHIPFESTDILADSTYQATYPRCGNVRENVMDTHKDTCEPNSHSRSQDDCSPDSVWFDGHKIEYKKYRQKKEPMEKHLNEFSDIGVSASA